MGKLFLSNDLLVRDTQLGMEWLEYAAKNGSHYAAYRVGKEYLKGKIVKKDVPKALNYFQDAAHAGNQYAQYMLGKLLLMGREVRHDKELALHWLTRSANQGNEYAQFFLDRADSLRPPSVMLAATRLLHHMANIFRDSSLPKTGTGGIQIDRKRLQKLREKKSPWVTGRTTTRNTPAPPCPCEIQKTIENTEQFHSFPWRVVVCVVL